MRRVIHRGLLLLVLTISGASSPAGAKKPPGCSPMPKGGASSWAVDGVWITPSDVAAKRRIKLSRREALVIRCVLERHLRSRRAGRAVAKGYRDRLARWRVGELDGQGPRIGVFWVSLGDRDDEIVLRTTLALRKWVRYGLSATLRRGASGWKVQRFGAWRAHRRR